MWKDTQWEDIREAYKAAVALGLHPEMLDHMAMLAFRVVNEEEGKMYIVAQECVTDTSLTKPVRVPKPGAPVRQMERWLDVSTRKGSNPQERVLGPGHWRAGPWSTAKGQQAPSSIEEAQQQWLSLGHLEWQPVYEGRIWAVQSGETVYEYMETPDGLVTRVLRPAAD